MKNRNSRFVALLCVVSLLMSACNRSIESDATTTRQPDRSKTAVLATVNANGICDYDLNESVLISAGWTKTFEDVFSSDLAKWNVWTGGAFNNELQLYQASNLSLTNGILNIAARAQTVTGPTTPYDATPKTFNYTSGRIESKLLFSASKTTPKVRMSARIKLPSGYGMWPAWWSYGDPWPTQGEIDILEARGQEPFQYQNNYFYGRAANRNLVQNAHTVIVSNTSLQDCWHLYEMVWSQNSLAFYFDGQLVDTKTGGYVSNLFGKKEKLVLNLAVGGLFFSNFNPSLIQTGTMQVDWVKVFTAK